MKPNATTLPEVSGISWAKKCFHLHEVINVHFCDQTKFRREILTVAARAKQEMKEDRRRRC